MVSSIGLKIKIHRETQKITQRELAAKTRKWFPEFNNIDLCRIEKGTRIPSLDEAKAIRKALGLETDKELFDLADVRDSLTHRVLVSGDVDKDLVCAAIRRLHRDLDHLNELICLGFDHRNGIAKTEGGVLSL